MEMKFRIGETVGMHFAVGNASLPTDPDPTIVHGVGTNRIVALSQNEYDALETKDSQTLYVIKKDGAE